MSSPQYEQLALLQDKQPKQLLKWIGNKQRFAPQIVALIPSDYKRYIEPFLGSGAVLGLLAPKYGLASDTLEPLIHLWELVKRTPAILVNSYAERLEKYEQDRQKTYRSVRDDYNKYPNPFDLLFISRSCYGGVVRFTQGGTISTPIGAHKPIPVKAFEQRAYEWHRRVQNTRFFCSDFADTMKLAGDGDVVYCDPPYVFSQAILYGAQDFRIERLYSSIEGCVKAGAKVILSIDGIKKSGKHELNINAPAGLFERELLVNTGRSMLRRFQRGG